MQPFGNGAVHSSGHRFARKARKLLSAAVGFFILYIPAHGGLVERPTNATNMIRSELFELVESFPSSGRGAQ